jgi:uncharacterized protein (TIGR02266 family)
VVRVKFKDRRQFESCWLKDISNGGIFLRTQTPAALFGKLQVVLELPNGDTVELQGEVVRVVAPQQAGPGVAAGMGVQFVDLNQEKRAQLESYLGFTQPVALPDGFAAMKTPAELETLPPLGTITPARGAPLPARTSKPPPPVVAIEDMVQGLRRLLWLCADPAALADADYYEVLGIPAGSTGTQIADACAVLRTLIDPQLEPPGVEKVSSARFRDLRRVLDDIEMTLLDIGRRARYDGMRRRR